MSYAQVAAGMKRSRSAVIGRTARLAGTEFPSDQARREARTAAAEEHKKMCAAVIAEVQGMPRDAGILFARRAGLTYREIAAGLGGISSQRVGEIVRQHERATVP
jgi:hypothetical protein